MIPVALTILAGVWRWTDGRGYGPTWLRNCVGLGVALASAAHMLNFSAGVNISWATCAISALVAWATLILGYTKWESLPWSVVRYGAPGCAIAFVGYLGAAPASHAYLYASACVMVGAQYPWLQRTGWKYATATSEVIAGAVIVGGLSWL